jgi:hypothetical protein
MAQQTVPVLNYQPPPNTYRSAMSPPEDYSFNGFNASVQVYPFRAFTGNIEQAFETTLLRDWISPMHKEENVAGQPQFSRLNGLPGAQAVITATFVENRVGIPRPHMRMLIVAGNEAAIVDASAATAQSWQAAIPPLNAMAATLRVDAGKAPPSVARGPGAAGNAVAGLYMGMKRKYMAGLYGISGGHFETALHYYLFSADGHVYRHYDRLDVPAGDPSSFDFDTAARNDPVNSGRYTIDGGQLYIQMQGQTPESIRADLAHDGRVMIDSVVYTRQ